MAAPQQRPDRIITNESSEPLNLPTLDAEEKQPDQSGLKGQPLSTKDERRVPTNPSRDASLGPPGDVTVQLESLGPAGGASTVYSPGLYAPQAQTFYYGGYENSSGEWGDYRQYTNAESLELGSPGVFNDNSSVMFHTGYGYNPQMPYGPYSPVTTPMPSVRGDGQLYSPQQFPFSGPPYYQQPIHPSMPYMNSPTSVSQNELTMPVSIDQQGDGMLFGPRAGYPPQFGSFGRGGSFTGNTGNSGFYDLRQGFDGFASGGSWTDWSKSADTQRSFTPLLSPAGSPQPINALGSLGRNVGLASQQHKPLYGFGTGTSSYTRGYSHNGIHQGASFGSASVSGLGMNERWLAIDKARRRGRDSVSMCGCSNTLDILSEQNRGPRASKPKNQNSTEHGSSGDSNKNDLSVAEVRNELYNRNDFLTEYEDAKFFIIKSYSEDNVHKSIKYGIWASTANGNRKLDAAYHEVKEKQHACPVFLLFSVNASAQFCGVAEMVGPVDFDRSVDYWQQDKWSGQFPVKWHIIKDVPNSQFRHIILENNDNKPVTNSRDTQEVKLEQGLEMLNILKNYETDLSILDDFEFYEERQKAMQERKARQQQASVMPAPVVVGVSEHRNVVPLSSEQHRSVVPLSSDQIKQMTKSFAQVVRLEEGGNKEDPSTEKGGSSTVDSAGVNIGVNKPEDPNITTMFSAVQGS